MKKKIQLEAEGKNTNEITSYFSRVGSWKKDSKNAVEYERKLVKFVASTNQSLAVIDNPEFRDLLPKEFNPPCRKSFTEKCSYTCFKPTKEKLLSDIKKQSTTYIGIQFAHTKASNYTPYDNKCVQHIKDDFKLRAL